MSYKRFLESGRIQEHATSLQEIKDLFALVERDIRDASIKELSADRRFATAYNAALQASKAIMYCEGYRPRGLAHHMTVFKFLEIALGRDYKDVAQYFDFNRVKRHIIDYDKAGQVSEKEARELLEETKKFLKDLRKLIKRKYPRFADW